MISVNQHVGRLIETRFVAPVTDDEVAWFAETRWRTVSRVRRRIVCLDATRVLALRRAQTELLVETLCRPSPGTLRRAFLLPPLGGALSVPVEQIVRAARSGNTKGFVHRAELVRWLGEVMTPEESARLSAFLDEHG